jgi:hypothetical protein
MSETLGSTILALDPEPEPGPEEGPTLSLTGIWFQDSDLSQPRYPSLIDPGRAPAGVQFEPCLQIRLEPIGILKIVFEIGEEGVSFLLTPGGDVQALSVFNPWNGMPPPGVESVKLIDGNPRKCELTWDQGAADRAGFSRLSLVRLLCQRVGPPLSAVEEVEGGIYLALLKRLEPAFGDPHLNDPGPAVPETIKVLGFDSGGRPVFDLFEPGVQDGLPESLALEPAFRCREGQIVDFSLALDLPDEIDIQFVTEPGTDQVQVAGFLPEGRPFQLAETTAGDFDGFPNRECSISWFQETGRQYCATSNAREARKCYCTSGQGSSFGLRATPKGVLPFEAPKGTVAEFDPTVIQPPSCTPAGICITP